MLLKRSVFSCECGNIHILNDSPTRPAGAKPRRVSYSDSDVPEDNGHEIGPRSILIRDAASAHATTLSYNLYFLTCKTCHTRVRIAVSHGRGFVEDFGSQKEFECRSSLVMDIPIQLRSLFEFDPTHALKNSQEETNTFDNEEQDDWETDSRAIIGSFERSSLMEFVSWEPLSIPVANSVP
jgi:hypothetical protein